MTKQAFLAYSENITALQLAQIKSKLESLANESLEIDCQIDDSLIGGFVAQLDGKVYDYSIKGKLTGIRAQLDRP